MGFGDYQKQVDDWARQFNPPYWPILEQLASLTEELGELSREITHRYGIKRKKQEEKDNTIGQELADMLFTICCIANTGGINLDEEFQRHMREKEYGRDANRFERKD